MPRVPTYQRQVDPRPLRTPQAPQEAFGSGKGTAAMGKAFGQISQDLEKRAREFKEEKDANRAMEEYTRAADQVRQTLYDTESGILSQRGKNALDAYEVTQEKLREIYNDTYQNLENDSQKQAFESMWNRKRSSALNSVARHQATQHRQWKAETTEAMTQTAIEDIIAAPFDPQTRQDAFVMGETAIRANAQGLPADAVERRINEFRTKAHAGVIEHMAQGDAEAAREYYEKHKDQIDGSVQTQIEKTLQNQGTKQKSQAETDRIVVEKETYSDQLEAARSIEDPDVRDATVRRVKVRHTEQQNAEQQARQQAYDNTIDQIIAAPDLSSALEIADSLKNGSDRLQARKVANSLKGQQKIETDPEKYAEARQAIDEGKIRSEQELIGKYWPHLSRKHRKEIADYWRQGGAVGNVSDSTVRTIYQSMTGERAKQNPEKYQQVWDVVTRNIDPNKKATDAELRNLVALALAEGERKGGGFGYGENMNYYQAEQKGYADSWLPMVDDQEERRITQALKSLGKKVSDKNIRLYKKHVLMGMPLSSGGPQQEEEGEVRNSVTVDLEGLGE